jgi:signal peptidase I
MDLRDVTEFLRDAGKYIIILVVIVFIFTFVVAFQPVAGNSMIPTMEEADVVLVSKFAYKFSSIKRNEVVIVKGTDGKSYIKRVIGLPGEEIHYLDNILYINGEPFRETFLGDGIETGNFLFVDICNEEDCPDGVIPEGKYLLLGDNRPESDDSRNQKVFGGLRSKKDIKGKVFFRIWPLNRLGKIN